MSAEVRNAKQHEHEFVENWAVVILIVTIILLAALFECCNHALEHWIEQQELHGLKHMLRAVFKELTILGFITLLLFTSIRTGLAQEINDKIFGMSETEKVAIEEALKKGEHPAPPTHLQELFEEIHILIFVVMAMYIFESAFLLAIGRMTIRAFEHFDQKSESFLTEQLRDYNDPHATHSVSKSEMENSIAFFGLKARFVNPPVATFPHPKEPEFRFSEYLAATYNELLVELIEIPVVSLLVLLVLFFFIRPFMGLEGSAFLILHVAVAFGLFFLTLFCTLHVRATYRTLIPEMGMLMEHLQPGTSTEATAIAKGAFVAPIDSLPVMSKTAWGARNRIQRQFPLASIPFFRSILQIILFANAAFAAVVIRGIFSASKHQSELWLQHWWWSYPLTLGIVCVNLTLWTRLIREFNYVNSLDSETKAEVIEEVEEKMEDEHLQRYSRILQYLFHKADHAEARRSPEGRQAIMERVQREFARLPPNTRNLISAIFESVATRRFGLVEKGEEAAGVVTQRNMREALRLMGWAEDETSENIVEAWFNERDMHQDGYLSFTGFVEVIMLSTGLGEAFRDTAETRTQRRNRLRQLFDEMDTNKDNKVSVDELKKVLSGLVPAPTEHEIKKLIHRISPGAKEVEFNPLVAFVDFVEAKAGGGKARHS